MMYFSGHNQDGFSLIEAVIAIAIIGIVMVTIFTLQQTVFRKDIRNNERLSRIFLLKNTLYDPAIIREQHDQELKKEKRVKEPPTEIKLIVGKMGGKVFIRFKYIERIIARALWEGLVGKEQEELLLLRFKVPEQKEKS